MATPPLAVAIYCHAFENNDPFSEDYYWQAYQELVLAIKSRGAEAYLVLDETSYLGHGRFATAYTLTEKTTLDKLTKVHNVTVDTVFNRTDFHGQDVVTINDPFVHHVGTDKIATYEYFGEFQPYSIACASRQEVDAAFERIAGDNIVVKKPVSHGGYDVLIGRKTDILRQLPAEYPLLVQEFLDTSEGIDGHVEGVHDLRLAVCGGEIISCFIRKAKAGTFHSNVAQGGELSYVKMADVPEEPVAMARSIDQVFAAYPRYYSVDCVKTRQGWKLIEINALIGMEAASDGPRAVRSQELLSDYLVRVCRDVRAKSSTNDGLVLQPVRT